MKEERKIKYKAVISIIFGLLGFVANFYTIGFPFPPYTAVVLIGLLFPMLITLTWGWKYGLLSALVGGCQSMWWLWGPSNGYATFFVVPPFTLWIVWHGLFAGWRRKHKEHGWWLNTYAVEIPFRILSTVNLYTLSRWAITLNPPVWNWASDASNTIPLHFSNFVVVKQAIVGYVILLLADVLLSFRFTRRFFRLKEDYSQASTGYIISASLLFGILFWALDSMLDYLVFHVGKGSFLDLVALNVPPDELFERTAFIMACLAGGVLSSRFLRRQRQAEAAIRESEERFRTLVETAPSLLQICDKEGNNIYVSPNCEKMTGFTQEELLCEVAWWMNEGDASGAEKFFESAFCEGLGGRNFEYRAVKKNGELWYASSSWEPLRDEEGRLKGVIFQTIDITERARAEEALAASEALYRSTIDALDDLVQVVNTNLEITLLNEAFVRWAGSVGVGMTDMIGRNLFQVFPFLSDRVRDECRKVLETGEMLITEETTRLAGRDFITETRKIPVFKDAGVDRIVTVVRDITERKRAEEVLRQRNRELALLNRVTRAFASTLDLDQVLDTVLQEVEHLLDVAACSIWLTEQETGELVCLQAVGPKKEIVGDWRLAPGEGIAGWVVHNDESLIVPDTREDERHFKSVEQQAGLDLRSILSVPLRVKQEVIGVIQVVDTDVDRFHSSDLALVEPLAAAASIAIDNARLYQQVRDHAERLEELVRERTAEVQAQYVRLEAVLHSISDGIIVANDTGEIIQANPVAQAWLAQTLSPEDAARLRETVRDLTMRVQEQPETVLELGGLDLELEAAPLSVSEAEEAVAVVAAHDISHLKALDRIKTRFISNVSHELRTPITTIKLYAALMQKKPEKWKTYLPVLAKEADHQARLVQDVLDISRMDAGRLELDLLPASLDELAEMTVANHQVLAQERGLALEHCPAVGAQPDASPVIAPVDSKRILQVLNNLVSNAIRYTPEGGEVAVSIGEKGRDGRTWATVTVADTGMGISEEELPHIFERFFRGEEPQSMQISGTGLGLAIAEEIVGLHGGRITVESQVGEGSAFTVWLPL